MLNNSENCANNIAAGHNLVIAISGDTMGRGDEELGKILMKAFIYSLTELAVPPVTLVFFNSGVLLASDGSNVTDDLNKLEEKGTRILLCGTCVNYYALQDKLKAGTVSNMYEIAEKMSGAAQLINI